MLHARVAAAIVTIVAAIAAALPAAAGAMPPAGQAIAASAEVQLGLCGAAEHIVHALGLSPRGAPITVWQFDNDRLELFERGLRLRLRVAADGSSELTLKVAGQDCAQLDPGRLPRGEGKCEYDVYDAGVAGAVSLTRRLTAKDTAGLLAGRSAPARMLSGAQLRYLREVLRVWPLPGGLRKLGPIETQRYRTTGKIYDVDISRLPDDAHYAEISRKVPTADASSAMEVLKNDLHKAGVAICDDQSSPAAGKLRALLR